MTLSIVSFLGVLEEESFDHQCEVLELAQESLCLRVSIFYRSETAMAITPLHSGKANLGSQRQRGEPLSQILDHALKGGGGDWLCVDRCVRTSSEEKTCVGLGDSLPSVGMPEIIERKPLPHS